MSDIPKFAFVGPVNPGKTSTIATLLEEDGLRISKVPGETTECQRFDLVGADGNPITAFYDTPGFQNARSMLVKLRELKTGPGEPLEIFRKFVAQYGGDPAFTEECRLLAPIIDGAGIIYVVDASQRVLAINEDEMEILRMTGQPVLGLINWTSEPVYKQEWKNALHLHFRAWEFNAHKATYFERIALLKTLIGLNQEWAPALERAVAIFEEDWKQRTAECAAMICDMLIRCLQHTETGRGEDEEAREKLVQKYHDRIRAFEREAHQRIIGTFKHNNVRIEKTGFQFEQDLFSAKTWELLGLNRLQLTWTGLLAGAAGGAAIDAVTVGHSLFIPTIVGAGIGAGTAFFGGEHFTKIKTPLPEKLRRLLGRETLGGVATNVGPNMAPNFPWILIDRAFMVYYFAIQRAHAQRDKVVIDPERLQKELTESQGLSTRWDKDLRSKCDKVFSLIRSGKANPEDREDLNGVIKKQLRKIAKA